MNWKPVAVAAAAALSIGTITVYAQPTQEPPRTMGPGMMSPGMMGGGPGSARGGRDDDDRLGWGMMGGRGTMGMMGMGRGMMDGMGMMGSSLAAIGRLDLSDTQRRQIQAVEDELRRKNWDLMGKMHDEMARMRDAMWATDKRDRAAILAANKRMSELRQQMLGNMLDAADKAEAALTPQQREQLRRSLP